MYGSVNMIQLCLSRSKSLSNIGNICILSPMIVILLTVDVWVRHKDNLNPEISIRIAQTDPDGFQRPENQRARNQNTRI